MEDLLVFVHFNGTWTDDQRFVDFSVVGVLIRPSLSFSEFKQTLFEALMLDDNTVDMKIEYKAANSYPPLEIKNDMSLRFYIQLKSHSLLSTEFPICVSTSYVVPASSEVALTETLRSSPAQDVQLELRSNSPSIDGEDSFCDEHLTYIENTTQLVMDDINNLCDDDLDENGNEDLEITDSKVKSIWVGQIFKDKLVMKEALSFYAMKKNFQFKTLKSCIKQYWLMCIDPDCSWRFRASKRINNASFCVRKYNPVHTCNIDERNGEKRQATRSIVAKKIKYEYLRLQRVKTPGDIVADIRDKLGAHINYQKAWRVKEEALKLIRGSVAESYNLLPSLLYMIQETNPGSIVNLATNGSRFHYLFLAMAACIQGWEHCRPIVVVDATFLKTCYNGTLISACGYDAAEKIFPLAFAVVDGENDDSWEWFFKRFKDAFGERDGMVIVSDRHDSIKNACMKVFSDVPHCICIYHLLQNLKGKFKSNIPEMSKYFRQAAKSYTVQEFEKNMSHLESIQRGIVPYLVKADFKKWRRVHSPNNRFNAMTSNSAESLNSVNTGAKVLPISSLVDYLRCVLQRVFYENRNIALNTFTPLLERHERKLLRQYDLASKMQVLPSYNHLVSVMRNGFEYVVDMDQRTCTCNRFQLDELPCAHVLAYIRKFHLSSYDYCSKFYSKEAMLAAYAGTIHPIPSRDTWVLPQDIKDQVILPPDVKAKPGRPRKQRYRSRWERKTNFKLRCSVCSNLGHNRRTCSGAIS